MKKTLILLIIFVINHFKEATLKLIKNIISYFKCLFLTMVKFY